jgi:hypothetical protein
MLLNTPNIWSDIPIAENRDSRNFPAKEEDSNESNDETTDEDEERDTESEEDEDEMAEEKKNKVITKDCLTYSQRREANIAANKVILDNIKKKYPIPDDLKPKPKVVLKKKEKKMNDEPVVRWQSERNIDKQRLWNFPWPVTNTYLF